MSNLQHVFNYRYGCEIYCLHAFCPGPKVKTLFMLNSAEHEISISHEYKKSQNRLKILA